MDRSRFKGSAGVSPARDVSPVRDGDAPSFDGGVPARGVAPTNYVVRCGRDAHTPRPYCALTPLIGATLLLAMSFAGCAKPEAGKALPPPVVTQVQTDTPEAAARSALLLMQNELRAIAARNTAETQRIHAAILGIVSRRDAEKSLKNVSGAKSLLGDDVVSGMVDLWTAAAAHYAEAIDFSSLAGTQGLNANEVSVYVAAKNGNDLAYLRVDCVREEKGWLVNNFAIDAAGPPRGGTVVQLPISTTRTAATKPASAPASQAASP